MTRFSSYLACNARQISSRSGTPFPSLVRRFPEKNKPRFSLVAERGFFHGVCSGQQGLSPRNGDRDGNRNGNGTDSADDGRRKIRPQSSGSAAGKGLEYTRLLPRKRPATLNSTKHHQRPKKPKHTPPTPNRRSARNRSR